MKGLRPWWWLWPKRLIGPALAALLAAGVPLPGAARALDHGEPLKIGYLNQSWGPSPGAISLREGLEKLGYRNNRDFIIGIRFTQGKTDALYPAALGLVRDGADVLVALGDDAALAAQRATARIPIVFTVGTDPVKLGLVKSFARPGGNMTGFTDRTIALSGKRLQVFGQLIPGLRRVLYVYSSESALDRRQVGAYRDAAQRLGLELVERAVHTEDEARRELLGLRKRQVDGIVSPWDSSLNILGLVLETSSRQRVPAMYPYAFLTLTGGLASYGPSTSTVGRLAARVIDKIIKGGSPADIPVEVNTEIEFAINLQTAKALGIKIAPQVLYQADRIVR